MKVAVAGGTGVVGRHVVEVAREHGHEAAVLSRSAGVDLRDESAVAEAVRGASVIVDAANAFTLSEKKATAFFTEATARLSRAGKDAGATHVVVLSIVGIERVPYPYYRAKIAQERAARAGPLPVTIVRATQFHEFAGQLLDRSTFGPLSVVPVMTVQPIAARAVAQVLVEAAEQPASTETLEIGGPRREQLVDMARATLERRGRRAKVLAVRVPGGAGRAMRGGALLPGPGARLLGPTFSDWIRSPSGP
ncbi:MAG TPA: NAD(P)H-binding protein [Acidimicrobiales bacterium]|nr:NAD(P)H-binding protein [Acidimicrobiales bacterium]